MGSELGSKLLRRIDRRIDVPAELFLGPCDRVHNIVKWCVSNHEEVDIACRAELIPRCRSEDERDLNRIA